MHLRACSTNCLDVSHKTKNLRSTLKIEPSKKSKKVVLQIFSPESSPRLKFVLDLFFNQILVLPFELIHDLNQIDPHRPLLNYSNAHLDRGLEMIPHPIMFESDIKTQEIVINNDSYFFRTSYGILPFDVFAMGFYMATRYEEYLPFDADKHNRFSSFDSLASKHHFLNKAIVHHWAFGLVKVLQNAYADLEVSHRQFGFLSTIDIDSAFAYKAKGMVRFWGGMAKSFLKFDLSDVKRRILVGLTLQKDPFDVYDWIHDLHQKSKIDTHFFILSGELGPYDKNIPLTQAAVIRLLNRLGTWAQIGLHPSYASNTSPEKIASEKNNLSDCIKHDISSSRQHFLKISFPKTYQNLIKNDIKIDYTLGFAQEVGFRAGLCVPYPFFDLSQNKLTPLTIVPFQIMDGTLNEYLKLSPEQAKKVIEQIIDEVKLVNGLLVTLWHNESLSETRHWIKWRAVYRHLIDYQHASKN